MKKKTLLLSFFSLIILFLPAYVLADVRIGTDYHIDINSLFRIPTYDMSLSMLRSIFGGVGVALDAGTTIFKPLMSAKSRKIS